MKLPTHEIQVGAIIGIRVWYVRDGYLHSSIGGDKIWWPRQRRVAYMNKRGLVTNVGNTCLRCPGRSAPCTVNFANGSSLQCGLHATPKIDYFPMHVPPYYTSGATSGRRVVFGLVRLFGRVVEGNYGWRAEFAEVHALCDGVPSGEFRRCDDITLTNMALCYEVPILYLEELSIQATRIGEAPCP